METWVLMPASLCMTQDLRVVAKTSLAAGTSLLPCQGSLRVGTLYFYDRLAPDDLLAGYGGFDECTGQGNDRLRRCSWVRFLRTVAEAGSASLVARWENGQPCYVTTTYLEAGTELTVGFKELGRPEQRLSDLYLAFTRLLFDGTPLDLATPLLDREAGEAKRSASVFSDSGLSECGVDSDPERPAARDDRDTIRDPDRSDDRAGCAQDETDCAKLEQASQLTAGSCETIITPCSSSRPERKGKRLLPCKFCGKTFDRPSLLTRHERTHTGERPHACDLCSKAFSTSSSLNTHRRIHSGDKPHQCGACGKRFTASSNLYYHRMTHVKQKPHSCRVCSKSFPTPGDLRSHQYIHSGSWPHNCSVCGRGFSKLTNLKNHLFLHTGERPHKCQHCHKSFALANNLKAHTKTHLTAGSSTS